MDLLLTAYSSDDCSEDDGLVSVKHIPFCRIAKCPSQRYFRSIISECCPRCGSCRNDKPQLRCYIAGLLSTWQRSRWFSYYGCAVLISPWARACYTQNHKRKLVEFSNIAINTRVLMDFAINTRRNPINTRVLMGFSPLIREEIPLIRAY